ncbi:hypothetical protein [Halochromatium salexigens]|uniref:Uncharacterized protein n=1 Tax=Halochromatium salexigens TaxID=49447 RepID=A0AAJ0XFA6_HALSE|nr:hypothetical protein [Halochromatium salexigens]MBK5929535.1 hypothetical protein [Halochromatium salexigens]
MSLVLAFAELVMDALPRGQRSPPALVVEVTETTLMQHPGVPSDILTPDVPKARLVSRSAI